MKASIRVFNEQLLNASYVPDSGSFRSCGRSAAAGASELHVCLAGWVVLGLSGREVSVSGDSGERPQMLLPLSLGLRFPLLNAILGLWRSYRKDGWDLQGSNCHTACGGWPTLERSGKCKVQSAKWKERSENAFLELSKQFGKGPFPCSSSTFRFVECQS